MDVDEPEPFYAKLFARAPVYDLVFTCLSPRSLFRVSLTCRTAYLAVSHFKTRAFNINRHLSRYFTDPVAFRSLLAKTNSLVSGSSALQFLDRTFYPEADLDLYTHCGHTSEVAQFLVEVEHYEYVPSIIQWPDWKMATSAHRDLTEGRVMTLRDPAREYPRPDIREVWTFRKTNAHQERLTVQIIEARSSPFETVLGFHSTCVMNFISSDAAYSLYPIATFENRSSLAMPNVRLAQKAIKKYVDRGWRIYYVPPPAHSAFFRDQIRWVSDEHTWRLPLDQTGVMERPPLSRGSAPLTCDPVLFNGWKVSAYKMTPRTPHAYEARGYSCDFYPLHTTLFRYNYALPDKKLQLAIRDWAYAQGQWFHSQIAKEDWIWFDADMPGFLDGQRMEEGST